MLALKDRRQVVEASLPGLADFAKVSLEKCREALKVLSEPDPYSRSKEYEGRRIREVEGGWEILNGEKYRDKMNADERRENNRIYQQRWRERQKRADLEKAKRAGSLAGINQMPSAPEEMREEPPMYGQGI